MYTKNIVLLLFFLIVSTIHALSPPFLIPLTHKKPEAATFNVSADGLLATVVPVTRYKRDLADVPITISQGSSVIITCKITLGPTRTPFTVLLDTGSPLLAIPTPGCKCDTGAPNPPYSRSGNAISCSESRCKQCCTSSVCPSNQCGFGVMYADGTSLNGSVYEDVIELGGLKSTVLFGGITQQSSGFVAPQADGIIGFSQDGSISCIPTCVPPVFSVFVKNGLVSNSFGIYLDAEGSGELSLGGIDPAIAPYDAFKYAPLLQRSNHYRIAMNQLRLDGTAVLSKIDILLDTGTTYMLLPRAEYQKLVSYLQENYCHLTGVCNQNNIFNGNCIMDFGRVAAFPNLSFQFDGLQVTVTPANYFLHTTMRGREGYCFGILPWPSEYAIFGYTFMRGNYIHYDMENRRIGFAGSNVTLGISSHSSVLSPSVSVLFFIFSFSFFSMFF